VQDDDNNSDENRFTVSDVAQWMVEELERVKGQSIGARFSPVGCT
jgi:hypothetical protein